jgi:hypothetical protein
VEAGYDYEVFVKCIDVRERELAAKRAADAHSNIARIVSSLKDEAVERIESAGREAQYTAAVELLGFGSAEQARSFAGRRHVTTWVRERVRSHLSLVARKLGHSDALDAARAARKACARESNRLGLPKARYVLKARSTDAVVEAIDSVLRGRR